MNIDYPSLVNLVISALIGVITSWWISHIYYLKNSPTERILQEIQKGLPNYLLPVVKPQFYRSDSDKVLPLPEPPQDKNIPHVEYAIFSKRDNYANDQAQALIKVKDLGFDLENPGGISVLDHLQRPLPVQRIGLGYIEVEFIVTPIAAGSNYNLTVSLRDAGGRNNAQSVKFHVAERS